MENIENSVVENENELEVEEVKEEKQTESYTKEEVLALIKSESDRRVSQALATQKKKYDKQLSLSKLDDNEREKAEKDNRIAELEEQLSQFQVEKNKSELKSVLSSRGLSAEFADIINISDNIEEAQSNIDRLDRLFKLAVKAEVEKRLAGNAPRGNSNTSKELTREDVRKMSISELTNLEKTNPELFNKFFN